MTHACLQLHAETRLLLFEYCTFILDDEDERRMFVGWLSIVDADLRNVTWAALDDQQRADLVKSGMQVAVSQLATLRTRYRARNLKSELD